MDDRGYSSANTRSRRVRGAGQRVRILKRYDTVLVIGTAVACANLAVTLGDEEGRGERSPSRRSVMEQPLLRGPRESRRTAFLSATISASSRSYAPMVALILFPISITMRSGRR